MGLFGRGKSGGMMNVIRCDEQEYLVWKWRPAGQEVNTTTRENSIRYGSSLRVKDGEMAVFVYKQKDGTMQDFIYGPYDDTIKTANFPVLSSIVGLAFGGESPFQADIYFINLAGVITIKFAVPYFNVYDPRFLDFGVPVSVGGSLTFKIEDPKEFIKLHRLINFSLDDLRHQIKDAVVRRIKSEVTNVPQNHQIPVVQLERRLDDINDIVKPRIKEDMEDFGVSLRRLDLSRIDIDKDSDDYKQLYHLTAGQQAATINAQTATNIKNMEQMQEINARNMEETLRVQREETQRAQRLQTETQFIGAHALNRQTDVMQTAAENMGNGGFGAAAGSSGINPAQLMTGMAVGGALGGQMAGMMNTVGQQMNAQMQQTMNNQAAGVPPIPGSQPETQYMLAINGNQYGPYPVSALAQYVQSGQLTRNTYVWTQGMAQWAEAGNVPELAALFGPPAPPMPGNGNPGAPVPPPMP